MQKLFGGNFFARAGDRALFRKRAAAFLEWARAAAIPLSLESAEDAVESLSSLDGALAGKQIVYLGEEDHWVHEKSSYRMLLLRYLISRGFTVIGEELGWSDGLRTERYLQTGDPSSLERIATYGYTGDRRNDRDELPRGLLKEHMEDYPTALFRAEQRRLLTMLRRLNETLPPERRVSFFGYDVNAVVGGGYADIGEQLHPFSHEGMVARLQAVLEPVFGETYARENLRLEKALAFLGDAEDELDALIGPDAFRALERNLETVQKSLQYHCIANSAASFRELNTAMALRETLMLRQVEYIRQGPGKGKKIVLMGHNRHLSKNICRIKSAGAGPPGGGLVPALGTSLYRRDPAAVFSIWMLFESGESSSPGPEQNQTYAPHPDRLNALLSRVGDTFLLPIDNLDPRADLLNRPVAITGLYNLPFRAAVAEQADALFFTRTVSKLRP